MKWACAMLVVVFAFSAAAVPSYGGTSPRMSASAATTLRVGELQEPDSLNVFVGVLAASYIVWAHVYELLVGIGPDVTPVPALAKDWSVDASHTVWTFHLQENATWHDGVPFTSEDVNFTYRYVYKTTPYNQDNATTFLGCDLLLLEAYLGDYDAGVGVDVGNISTPDAHTIIIPTYQPKANILSMFIQILPWHLWHSISCDSAQHVDPPPVIGTGMYKLTSWQKGAYVQLDLNTDYWQLDQAHVSDYVQTILIEYYQTASVMYNDLRTGKIDATDALTTQQFLALRSTGDPGFSFFAQPSLSMTEMGGCLASDALISDNEVPGGRNWLVTNRTIRQAMQMAMNRSFLVDNILGDTTPGSGLGVPGSTLIPPATLYWHLNITAADALDNRIEDARLLLDDPAGDGMTMVSGHTDPGDYGEWLDPAAANNADAFAAVDPAYPNVRVPIVPANVQTGEEWGATGGASAPNRDPPYPLSFVLDVINTATESSDAADIMIQWWSQVGIQVTKRLVAEATQIANTYDCAEDFYMWGWGMDVDPDFALSVMASVQILNWQDAWYSNENYDADYALQQTQVIPQERQETIWRMQEQVYYDAAYLILWYGDTLTVVRTSAFTGWTAQGDWVEHPGLGLTGWGNDRVMLGVRAAAPAEGGLSALAIVGIAAVIGVAVIAVAAVLLLRRRKKGEEPEAPIMPPPKQPGPP